MTLLHRSTIARRRIVPSSLHTVSPTRTLTSRFHNLSLTNNGPPTPATNPLTPISTPAHTTTRLLCQPHPNRPFTTTPPLHNRKKKLVQKKDMRITLIRYHLQHPLTPRPLRFSRTRSLRHWTIHRAYQLFRSKQRQARELELERQFCSMRDACEALRLIGEDGLAVEEGGGSRAVRPPGARDPGVVAVDGGTGRVYGPGEVRGLLGEGGKGKKLKQSSKGAEEAMEEGIKDRLVHFDLKAAAEKQKDVGRLYRNAMLKTGIWDGVPIEYARAQTETPPRNGWDHKWTR